MASSFEGSNGTATVDAPRVVAASSSTVQRPLYSQSVLRKIVIACSGLFLWIALIQPPQVPAASDLDRSWGEAYTFFAKHGLQAGEDYIFTYGPLGHLMAQGYDSQLFWTFYLWELCFKAVLAFILMRFALHLPGWPLRAVFLMAIALSTLLPESARQTYDGVLTFAIVAAFALVLRADHSSLRTLLPFSAFVVVISLMKFTLFLFCSVTMTALVCCLAARRRYADSIQLAVFAVICFLIAWSAAGQSVTNLQAYVTSSMEVARGYEEAMADNDWPFTRTLTCIAALTLALFGIGIAPGSVGGKLRHMKPEAAAILLLAWVEIFLAWKHGFVRADPSHILGFFRTLLWLAVAARVLFPQLDWTWPVRNISLSACASLCSVGMIVYLVQSFGDGVECISNNVRIHTLYLIGPTSYRAGLDNFRSQQAAKWALPRIKAAVGGDTIDIMSFDQGVAFLNSFNWHPRPIFQSYSAYTPTLLKRNAEHFRGQNAPRFVIHKPQTINARFPTLDDSAAFEEIIRRYEPIICEKSYVLFEKRESPELLPQSQAEERLLTFGQNVALDGHTDDCQYLALKFSLSKTGLLWKSLLRVPEVKLVVGTATGKVHTFRLVPSMAEAGFLVNPLILSQNDVIDLFRSVPGDRVVSFRVECASPDCYDREIKMTMSTLPKPRSVRTSPVELKRLLYPMMKSPPDSITRDETVSDPLTARVEHYPGNAGEKNVLFVSSGCELRYNLSGDATRIEGAFGSTSASANTRFLIEYQNKGDTTIVLLDTLLQAKKKGEDGNEHSFSVDLPSGAAGELILKVQHQRPKAHGGPHAYWSNIRLATANAIHAQIERP